MYGSFSLAFQDTKSLIKYGKESPTLAPGPLTGKLEGMVLNLRNKVMKEELSFEPSWKWQNKEKSPLDPASLSQGNLTGSSCWQLPFPHSYLILIGDN